MKKINITKISECKKFASEFSKKIKEGNVIFLKGNLGSGKTTFIKFVLEKLKIKNIVKSPSFNLVNVYESNNLTVCHMDLYRLKDNDDLEPFLEYIDGKNIVFVEWPELFVKMNIDCNYFLEFIFDSNSRDVLLKKI